MINKDHQTSSPKAESLLIDLYKYSNSSPKANIIKAKFSPKGQHHPELELFKQQLEENKSCAKHQTYAMSRNKVFRYRAIFFLLGMLFIGLCIFVFNKNLPLMSHMVIGGFITSMKNIICGISAFFAVLALGFGYSLCIVKESAQQIASKAKRRLLRVYAKKRIEQGITGLFALGWNYSIHSSLRQSFDAYCEKIDEKRDETIQLLKKIKNSRDIEWENRELLFNQAIAEMNEQTRLLVHNFKEC